MTYLVTQILSCLILAFLLGGLSGWWLGLRRLQEHISRLEIQGRRRIDGCRRELETCRKERDRYGEERASLRRQLAAGLAASGAARGETAEARGVQDDLTRIEGIGPKIEGLLNARGILTWKQLASTEVQFLQSVLDEAGTRYQIHDPSTWPEQARLAAAASWDELTRLQDRLRGGRES